MHALRRFGSPFFSRQRRLLLCAGLLGLVAKSAQAQSLPDLVEAAKPSVLLVGSFGMLDSPRFGFRGTGFVVGDGNQAITNAHVLPTGLVEGGGRSVAVQVYTGKQQWSLRSATVEAVDTEHDLALLRFGGQAAKPLKLASDDAAVREGSEVAVMGFPLGGALGFSHVTHRGILAARTAIALPAPTSQSLNARAVMALRQGSFEILQLDITAYPGNSGGPVFDVSRSEVVGVVSMVLIKGTKETALTAPSGISYAVPVAHVRALLERR